ncbi:hypothetical protein niasHS_016727 [Heterodera schachtii]|uniref:G protein-coupled receptor n=1 Tax=Heterodera schachtii TaxID=97005 RepID=A0ABD2HY04_HETSC
MLTINTTLTDSELFFLFFGGAVEMLTNFLGIPLSITNLILVARTAVIHPNMKAILIYQSFSILTRGICRFVICLFKFILWDPISAENMSFFPDLARLYFFGVYSRHFVPHVLIIERILATLFARAYERCRGCLFTLLWSPIAFTISIYIAFTTEPQKARPLANLFTIFVELVAGIMEFAIFIKLCRHNTKIYQKMLQNDDSSNNLSLRYQLSENIRIGKLLIPPLLCNLFGMLNSLITISWSYFQLPHYYMVYNLAANFSSVIGLMIELFIITCHPFLKRDLCKIWHHFGTMLASFSRHLFPNNHRISDQNTTGTAFSAPAPTVVGIAQIDLISGKALTSKSKTEEHFATLKKAWQKQ